MKKKTLLLNDWLQHHHLPKVVLVNTKPQVQLGGVVLQDPLERVVIFTVLQGDNARQVKTWGARGEDRPAQFSCIITVLKSWWFNKLRSYHRLHVFQGDLFSQHHLVERPDEETYVKKENRVYLWPHVCKRELLKCVFMMLKTGPGTGRLTIQ